MSIAEFIAADWPLPEHVPSEDYPLHVDLDAGTSYDGDADDNYCLCDFIDVKFYTDFEYGVLLEWAYCTEGRARQIIQYVQSTLQYTDCVELWQVWLGDLDEEERPIIKTLTISAADLTPADIQKWDDQTVWKTPTRFGDRPTFHCLRIPVNHFCGEP